MPTSGGVDTGVIIAVAVSFGLLFCCGLCIGIGGGNLYIRHQVLDLLETENESYRLT